MLEFDHCPADDVSDDVWEAVRWHDLAQLGIIPLAGGGLDQAQSYLIAMQLIAAEENRWKKELGIFE